MIGFELMTGSGQTFRSAAKALGATLALVLLLATAAQAEGYRLGPQDKLNVRVFEWQTVEGAVREWPALTGVFTVGADGTISLPLLGAVPASGRFPGEIGADIGRLVQDKFGLADRPEASVEIEAYRPFYIEGSVRQPGQFAFVPGLTVLQAFSLAGGFPERVDYGTRVSRDLINAAGSINILRDERARLLIRRARLEAEAKEGTDEIAVPEISYMSPDEIGAIVADEQAIMESQSVKVAREISALDDLKVLLEGEIEGLREKIASLDRQIELARKEREGVSSLKQKGLVVNSRILGAERLVADMESRKLDLVTGILRAEQERSKATQSQIGLRTSYAAQLASERQQTEASLGQVETKIGLQQSLRQEALTFAAATEAEETTRVTPAFTIVRTTNGISAQMEADTNTLLAPGDVLRVRIEQTASQ